MSNPAWVGAIARYQKAMSKAALEHLFPLTDDVTARASQGIGSLLFGAVSSDPIRPKALKRDEVVFQRLFSGMVEITEAFDMLQDAEVYIQRFSHRGLIPPHRFMRYHITNFYNNAYVLSQRLDQYATIVGRSYKKSTRVANIEDRVSKLKSIVLPKMKPITEERGRYIHQNHFADDHFERLSMSTLLAARKEGEPDDQFAQNMARLHKVSFRRARKEWLAKIVSNNRSISEILDVYFHFIHGIVFDKADHIVYPVSPRAMSD